MFKSRKLFLSVSVLIFLFCSNSQAESLAQSQTEEQLNAQIQELQTQISTANTKISELEEVRNLNISEARILDEPRGTDTKRVSAKLCKPCWR